VTIQNADGTVQTASIRVVVFPWPIVAGAAGVALVLIFGLRRWRRRTATGAVTVVPAVTPPLDRPAAP